jgi:hypothetical protein
MGKRRIDRRDFIKGAAITGAGLALGGGLLCGQRALANLLAGDQGTIDRAIRDHKLGEASDADAQATVAAYMTKESGKPKVVHIHSTQTQATNWDFGSDYYGRHVDQDVVDDMVDRGVMELTGTSSIAQAWQVLLPDYVPGKAIAIKVNFNNAPGHCTHDCETDCEDWQLKIDALINPINAVTQGLKQMGVVETDIWVYDATPGREIPGRFTSRCQYSGVQFFDTSCNNPAQFESDDPNAYVTFSPPTGIPVPPAQKITDVLIDAAYLINIPILKKHMGAGVSLSFKNHFGSIDDCAPLHDWISDIWGSNYSDTYNPMVDMYLNPHIANKTILTIGDGLFGDRRSNVDKPTPWDTFGEHAPNSLFFATDPVAIDSVMCDFLHIESYDGGIYSMSDDYLKLAEAAGLGTYERGDPWGSGYTRIDYDKIEI